LHFILYPVDNFISSGYTLTMRQPSLVNQEAVTQQLSRLVEISLTLNSTLDLDQLLKFIIKTAADVLDCEAASILLFDEKREELFFATSSDSDLKQLAEIPVPIEGSIAGSIFRENQPLMINNVQADPRHFSQVGKQLDFNPRSLLGVPMRIRSNVTGVLEALNKRGGEFNDDDVHLLSVIASQAAVAIHNARLVQALQKAYTELSRLDKLKSDFIAIASHELRTPLGVILGYATFLKEDARGDLTEHAEIVLNSAIKLRGLVEDMTNLNLMHVGETHLELQNVSIQSILQAACKEIQVASEAKGQKLFQQMPDEGITVNADPNKLERVFSNILNNAVRFTPEGGEVRVLVQPEQREVWIVIKDNGVGIPANELENIFDEFYQVEDHRTRRHGGLGLGLSIARGLIILHNGRIWAESEGIGRGVSLKVVLPLANPIEKC
jgi:signal transduction histidine kinase